MPKPNCYSIVMRNADGELDRENFLDVDEGANILRTMLIWTCVSVGDTFTMEENWSEEFDGARFGN